VNPNPKPDVSLAELADDSASDAVAGPPITQREHANRALIGKGCEEGVRAVFLSICEEKHSHTAAHHLVVKPPAVHSTAVSHTPTQLQGGRNY